MSGSGKQHIYLDPCIIIGFIKPNDDMNRESNKIIHKISGMLKYKTINVYLSNLVLAEVLREISSEREFYNFQTFIDLVSPEYRSIDFETMRIALEIHDVDDRIEPQDALIVASAIGDPYSTRFITYDSKILESVGLRDLVNKRSGRKNRLRFTSDI